jgi:hypothetical protein
MPEENLYIGISTVFINRSTKLPYPYPAVPSRAFEGGLLNYSIK